jgi:subtilisin-like proprotein convertase family protein
MDAGLMTWYAKSWKNVPTMSTCESMTNSPNKTIVSHSNEMFTVDLTECKDSIDRKRQVNYIEQVQVFVTLKTSNRGEIEIYLFSPSNTKTQLLPVRLSESLIRILLICVI